MSSPALNTEQLCPEKKGLKRDMKSRHLMMISIGGTIGTGLFMGSGQTISQAGPFGAILAYMVGGFIMYMVLLCLAELTVPKLCITVHFTRCRFYDGLAILD